MSIKWKHVVPLVFLLVISLWGVRGLYHSGFYTSHDGWHQIARLYHFDRAVRAGQIPPRYSFELLNGYGYPLFTFNYHLPWILAEPFVLAGVSIFTSVRVVFILGYVVSGLTMFWWQRKMWGSFGAFIASFLYLWAPYRFSNIFVRASLGEATSFIFLPLIFLGIHGLQKKRNLIALIAGVMGIAGIVLSHSMMLLLMAIPVFIFTVVMIPQKRNIRDYLIRTSLMLSVGILLPAYYLLPAWYFKNTTIFSGVEKLFFQQQFVKLADILYSPWGYAASFSGVGQMSLQLGIAQWIVVSIAGALIFFRIVLVRKSNLEDKIAGAFFAAFLTALILMTPISKPVWEMLGKYLVIDFPWRFLAILTLLAASLGGYVVYKFSSKIKFIVAIGFIVLALYANRNHQRVNEYTDIPLSLYIASERTTNTFNEYLPKGVDEHTVTQDKRTPVVIESFASTSSLTQTVDRVSFIHTASESAIVKMNNIYFPGVISRVDGKSHPFTYTDGGLVKLELLPGTHTVELLYREPTVGKIANALSIAGVACLIYIGMIWRKKEFTKLRSNI